MFTSYLGSLCNMHLSGHIICIYNEPRKLLKKKKIEEKKEEKKNNNNKLKRKK